MEFEIVKFDVTEAEISKAKTEYMPLKIEGIKDVAGYTLVHQARMAVVKMRTSITKAGKAWRDQINAGIKKEQAEEKRLLAMIEPIETHLDTQESAIDNEKARIKADAEAAEKARVQGRINRLFALGCKFDGITYRYQEISVNHANIPDMTDPDFERKCGFIQGLIDIEIEEQEETIRKHLDEEKRQAAERERLKAKEAELKAEADRIAREQAKKEAEIAIERAAIDAEKRKIEEEKRLEHARKEAAEKARIEIEARLKREAEDKERRAKIESEEKALAEERAKAEAKRQEELKPDKGKLIEWAAQITNLGGPDVKSQNAKKIVEKAEQMLDPISDFINAEVKKL